MFKPIFRLVTYYRYSVVSSFTRCNREQRLMRQLIGKIPTKNRGVIDEVYVSEFVRCRDCQRTVPMGIEVATVRIEGKSKKLVKRAFYCRAHGANYDARAQGA